MRVLEKQAVPDDRSQTSATALEVIECAQRVDMGSKEGKRAFWLVLTRCGPLLKAEYTVLRDKYRSQGLEVGESNRLAALDVAARLPTAVDLPAGLLESLRVEGATLPMLQEADVGLVRPNPDPGGPSNIAALAAKGRASGRAATTQFDTLLEQVEELSDGKPVGIARSVVWVSAHLRTSLTKIKPEHVPGPEALAMLQWAQQNETEYRRLYDSKRIPTKGIAEDEEKGFIDGGGPIEDIMRRIAGAVSDELGR